MTSLARIFALLLFAHCAHAASVTLSLPAVSGSSGFTIPVTLSVRDAQGMGAFQCDVLYPPNLLEATGVDPGTLPTGLFNHNVVEPGRLRIVMAGDPQNPVKGSGTLFNLQFKVLHGETGAPMPLILDRARAWEQTKDSLEMRVTTENGSFQVGFGLGQHKWLIIGAVATVILLLVILAWKKKPRQAPMRAPECERSAQTKAF
ncbi:MAG: cohesin domain-containing protein [Verrucomicrobia bacterium]|nr:cohesin domain-containing protein [Verrucomicrobiota bacterium]